MVTLGIPGLCGANANLDAVLGQVNAMKKKLILNLESPASTMATALSGDLVTLNSNVKRLVPELSTLPSVPLQAEMAALIGIDKTTIKGLVEFTSKLAQLKSQFGPILEKKGKDLDALVIASVAASLLGKDLCNIVPNLQLPSGGQAADAVEKAVNSLMPDKSPTKELKSVIKTASLVLLTANKPLIERQNVAISAIKTAKELINFTVDRNGGTVTPETRNELKKIDSKIKNSTVPTPPAIQRINNSISDLLNLKGTGTSPAIDDDSKNDKQNDFMNYINGIQRDFMEKINSLGEAVAIKSAKKGYPHNLVSDDSNKMLVWPEGEGPEVTLSHPDRGPVANTFKHVVNEMKSGRNYIIEKWKWISSKAIESKDFDKETGPSGTSAIEDFKREASSMSDWIQKQATGLVNAMKTPVKEPEGSKDTTNVPIKSAPPKNPM
ncbi:MAG: hypothetical protein CMO16_07300 [Thaumarchaeota archaeon]|nr:hypothetical protein [Nitrososphaerota archaeon]